MPQMPAIKTTFLLKGIDITDIARRYSFIATASTDHIELQIPTDVTELSTDPVLHYHDSARRQFSGVITMVDYIGRALPDHTNIHCDWCRHPFDTLPLGVPVKYVPSEAVKRYKSDTITRLTVEAISDSRRNELRNEYGVTTLFTQEPSDFSHSTLIVDGGYYLSDAIVCSFECMAAWIDNHTHDPLFSRSKMYMKRMVRDTIGDMDVIPAGSYRLLTAYGGHLDIVDFRKGFTTVTYRNLSNPLFEHPVQKSIGWLHSCDVRF